MMTTIETWLRRSRRRDRFGAALILACLLVLLAGGWAAVKGGATLFHLGAPAVASSPETTPRGEAPAVLACRVLPAR